MLSILLITQGIFFTDVLSLAKTSHTCPFTVKLHVINLKFIYKTKAVRDLLARKTTTQYSHIIFRFSIEYKKTKNIEAIFP